MATNAFGVQVSKSFSMRAVAHLERIATHDPVRGARVDRLLMRDARGPAGNAALRSQQSRQQLMAQAKKGRLPRAMREHGYGPNDLGRAVYRATLRDSRPGLVRGVGGTEVGKMLALTSYKPRPKISSANPFVKDDVVRLKRAVKGGAAALGGVGKHDLDRRAVARKLKKGSLVALRTLEAHIP